MSRVIRTNEPVRLGEVEVLGLHDGFIVLENNKVRALLRVFTPEEGEQQASASLQSSSHTIEICLYDRKGELRDKKLLLFNPAIDPNMKEVWERDECGTIFEYAEVKGVTAWIAAVLEMNYIMIFLGNVGLEIARDITQLGEVILLQLWQYHSRELEEGALLQTYCIVDGIGEGILS